MRNEEACARLCLKIELTIRSEHHATNRTSLAGLDQSLLFFGPPHIRFEIADLEMIEY